MAGKSQTRVWVVVVSGLLALAALGSPSPAGARVKDDSVLYVPKPVHGAKAQIADLRHSHQKADAELIESMIDTPQAVWFTQGTPKQVEKSVKATVKRAKHTVPVLVAYNLPFRDCGQFSAGGATDTASYLAWIDGFAKGIGNGEAIVVLEPDGLGIIPYNTDINGIAEWCQPDLNGTGLTPEQANQARYDQLNGAVDRLEQQPNVSVYLDGTHSAWLGVGDIAQRLVKAGVQRAQGFFLNVSNYQFTPNLVQYGTWISDCIAYATIVAPGGYGGCPNQYWNGGPLPSLLAQLYGEWNGVALSNYGQWSDTTTVQDLNTSAINLRYANMLGATVPTTHFVIDTSRNGQGPWAPPAGHPAGDPQDWCNPPDRGTGMQPTLDTSIPLVDAYLWVKIPGASDGQCNRWAPAGSPDPVRNMIDPPAGAWFPEMALELAQLANPPLLP